MPDLNDVDTAAQSDGNVIASGGSNYREEDISSLTEDHVAFANLSDFSGIGNGLENNGGTLRVNPAGIAGDGLKETSATSMGVEPSDFAGNALEDDGSDSLAVKTSSIQTDEIDESISPTWTGAHTFTGSAGSGWPFQVDVASGDAKSGSVAEWIANLCHDGTALSVGVEEKQATDAVILKATPVNAEDDRPKLQIGATSAPAIGIGTQGSKLGVQTIIPNFALDVSGTARAQTSLRTPTARTDSTYSSGYSGSGWIVQDTGPNGKPDFLEASHMSLRGTLRVRELILSQISVERGKQIISPGGGKVASVASSSHTSVSNTFGTTTKQEWTFENDGGKPMRHGLAVGDRVLAQRFDPDGQSVVTQIRAVVDNVPSTEVAEVSVDDTYTVPSTGEEKEGYTFSVVGSSDTSRDSFLFDDPFGPRRTYTDGVSNFFNWGSRADFERVAIGNLNGRYGYGSETYGMAAGDPSGEHITADAQNGVRIIDGANSNTLAQLSGSVLTLGSAGQIEFDPTSSPEAKITGTLEMSGSALIRDSNDKYRIDPAEGISLNVPSSFVVDRAYTIHDQNLQSRQWIVALHATRDANTSQINAELETTHPNFDTTLNIFTGECHLLSRNVRTLIEGTEPNTVNEGGLLVGPDYTEFTGDVLGSAPNSPSSGIKLFLYDNGTETVPAFINSQGNAYELNKTSI